MIFGFAQPTGPAGPVAPVAPSAPAGPCGPVAPSAPSAPAAPVGPCGPVAPSAPSAPAGPCAPVGPVGPVAALTRERTPAPSIPTKVPAPGSPSNRTPSVVCNCSVGAAVPIPTPSATSNQRRPKEVWIRRSSSISSSIITKSPSPKLNFEPDPKIPVPSTRNTSFVFPCVPFTCSWWVGAVVLIPTNPSENPPSIQSRVTAFDSS